MRFGSRFVFSGAAIQADLGLPCSAAQYTLSVLSCCAMRDSLCRSLLSARFPAALRHEKTRPHRVNLHFYLRNLPTDIAYSRGLVIGEGRRGGRPLRSTETPLLSTSWAGTGLN